MYSCKKMASPQLFESKSGKRRRKPLWVSVGRTYGLFVNSKDSWRYHLCPRPPDMISLVAVYNKLEAPTAFRDFQPLDLGQILDVSKPIFLLLLYTGLVCGFLPFMTFHMIELKGPQIITRVDPANCISKYISSLGESSRFSHLLYLP